MINQSRASYPDIPQRRSDTGIIVVVIVAIVLVAVIGSVFLLGFYTPINIGSTSSSNHSVPTQRASNIVHGVITVPAGSYTSYTVDLPTGSFNVIVSGSFTASGGSGNDIQVFIMDKVNFDNWLNGHQYYAPYNSGQTTTGSINAALPGGVAYYLVYSNRFSTVSSKSIDTNVNVSYYA